MYLLDVNREILWNSWFVKKFVHIALSRIVHLSTCPPAYNDIFFLNLTLGWPFLQTVAYCRRDKTSVSPNIQIVQQGNHSWEDPFYLKHFSKQSYNDWQHLITYNCGWLEVWQKGKTTRPSYKYLSGLGVNQTYLLVAYREILVGCLVYQEVYWLASTADSSPLSQNHHLNEDEKRES